MASTGLGSVLRLLLLLGLVLCLFQHGRSFAKLQQESAASNRERSGLGVRKKFDAYLDIKLNQDERRLLRKISTAGERWQWSEVRSVFASYTGDAVPIYTEALHAAVRCREYREGAKMFEQGQQRCEFMNAPMYTQALKIYGKLKDFAKVDELWSEALEVCGLDEFLASARLAAAADQGDIEGAATVLDQVNASGIPLNVVLITSAIRSCWSSSKFSDRAARYFYDLFGKLGLTPTAVTFGSLVGAFKFSPLEDVLWAYQEMKAQQIAPDRIFAETLVICILGGGELKRSMNDEVFARENLFNKPKERLQAAREALDDFESQGVELSGLCRQVKSGLRHVGF